jgi:Domain of unknown function (DUF4160)
MPIVLRSGGFRVFFYSNEGRPRALPHVHVEQAGSEAKFWLRPVVSLAYNDGFDARTLQRANEIGGRQPRTHREELE